MALTLTKEEVRRKWGFVYSEAPEAFVSWGFCFQQRLQEAEAEGLSFRFMWDVREWIRGIAEEQRVIWEASWPETFKEKQERAVHAALDVCFTLVRGLLSAPFGAERKRNVLLWAGFPARGWTACRKVGEGVSAASVEQLLRALVSALKFYARNPDIVSPGEFLPTVREEPPEWVRNAKAG